MRNQRNCTNTGTSLEEAKDAVLIKGDAQPAQLNQQYRYPCLSQSILCRSTGYTARPSFLTEFLLDGLFGVVYYSGALLCTVPTST